MPGQKPVFRFKTRGEQAERFSDVGAAWETSKEGVFSVRIKTPSGEFSCIMTPVEPKVTEMPEQPRATTKRKAAPQARPAA